MLNIHLPFDLAVLLLPKRNENILTERPAQESFLQLYSQYLQMGNYPDVHQQERESTNCDIYIMEYDSAIKRINHLYMRQHGCVLKLVRQKNQTPKTR